MKSFYWSLLLVASLMTPAGAAPKAKKQTKKAEAKQEAKKEEAKPESPAPSPAVEKALTGLIEIGYRGMSSLGGDENTFRSVVNTRTGLRLTAMELNFIPEKSKAMDEAHFQVHNWGDPYNTARLEIGKRRLWHYSGRYSNMFYYNNLPSFANANAPGLYVGNQRAMDTMVRNYDNRLEFLPSRIVTPYLGYQRNTSSGTGVTPMVLDGNDYPLRTNIAWGQNTLLAGVRVTLRKAHATIEQGRTSFNDDQYVYSTEASNGSRLTPILGQTQVLTSGSENYIVRGRGPYTKVYGSGSIGSFLDLTGMYVHSRPELTTKYNQAAAGKLFVPSLLTAYPGQTDSSYGAAQAPHTLAGISAEAHFGIIRIRHTFDADRYETFSSANMTTLYSAPAGGTGAALSTSADNLLKIVNNRQTTEVIADVLKQLTIRGGYRREWGSAHVPGGIVSPEAREFAELKCSVVMAGIVVRPITGLLWTSDFELGDSDKTIYRVSLAKYKRWRNQVRYQYRNDLSFQGSYSLLVNQNDLSQYQLDARQASLSAQWFPHNGKNLNIIADYTRSTLASDINYLVPLAMVWAGSNYRDNAHTGTLLADIGLPGSGVMGLIPRFTGGGSFVTTSGTRPSRYWQPIGKLTLPVNRLAAVYAEWRWYGFRQPYYPVEGFRSHQVTAGIRLTL